MKAHSPVDADSTKVEDAGGAHHHIQRDEDVTVEPAEKPGAANHLRGTDSRISHACILLSLTVKCEVPAERAPARPYTWRENRARQLEGEVANTAIASIRHANWNLKRKQI